MKKKKYTFKKSILVMKLVEDDIVNVKQNLENNDVWWLGQILENGFVGYKHQTIRELEDEVQARELDIHYQAGDLK